MSQYAIQADEQLPNGQMVVLFVHEPHVMEVSGTAPKLERSGLRAGAERPHVVFGHGRIVPEKLRLERSVLGEEGSVGEA